MRALCSVILCLVCPAIAFAQAPPAAAPGMTIESQLCRSVLEREPVEPAESFPADVGQVFLWTKVTGATDSVIIKHVWFYEEQEMATVELPVRSSLWRTWSSKNILPQWTGNWQVKIVDAEGNIFKSVSFTITAPTAVPEATEVVPEEAPPEEAPPEETPPAEEEVDTSGRG